MDRLTNRRLILGKIQTAHDVDPLPTPAANAIEVFDLKFDLLKADKKEIKPVRPFPGGKASKLANQHLTVSFKVQWAGSGTAGVAPKYAHLLRACSLAEIVTANTRVDYKPINSAQEEMTLYYNEDGLLHKLINCKGDVSLAAGIGDVPMLAFSFTGMKGGRVVEALPGGAVYVGFKDALIVSSDISTLTLNSTAYPSNGLDVSLGNAVAYKERTSQKQIRSTDRSASGKLTLDLDPTQQQAIMTTLEASGTFPLSFVHGTTAGNICSITAPAIQLLDPSEEDDNGTLLHGYSFDALPLSGNDEVLFSFA